MKKGASLVEVLFYLLVVIALVVVLLSSTGTLSKSRDSNSQTIANSIASCEIENLRNMSFSSLPATGAIGAPCSQDLVNLHPPNSAQRTVADFQSDANIKLVTIDVTWTEKGVLNNFKLQTLISKYGL